MAMQLTAMVFVSVDGVYQGPGGPDEDRRAGFDRGGWQASHIDDETGTFIRDAYERADAMLLGRVTWSIWETYWPKHDDNPIGHIINTVPKYVPSHTLRDPAWSNTQVISGNLEDAIRELKAKPGREILLQGSGALLRWLLEHDLVDELVLPVYPVVVGAGLRLFPEHGQTHDLELVESRATPSGVTIQTYRPAGRPLVSGATNRRPPR
jgi:dihydrofolate reductase